MRSDDEADEGRGSGAAGMSPETPAQVAARLEAESLSPRGVDDEGHVDVIAEGEIVARVALADAGRYEVEVERSGLSFSAGDPAEIAAALAAIKLFEERNTEP